MDSDIYNQVQITTNASSETKQYTGISAGNERHNLNAVWIRGTYGHVKQGKNLKNSKFFGNIYGTTVGVDGNITDDTVIGISYTRLYADFKYNLGLGHKASTVSDIMIWQQFRGQYFIKGFFSLQTH